MTRAAEDLLTRARRGELSEDEARRFEIVVGSSRELELLYEAGVQFDAQAQLLPGDEERMSALVAGALAELEHAPPRAATSGVRRAPRRHAPAWRFAGSVGLGVLLSVALAGAWQLAERHHLLGAAPPAAPAPARAELDRSPVPAAHRAAPVVSSSVSATPVEGRRRVGVAGAAPSSRATVVAAEPQSTPASPNELFVRANEARRSGERAAAIALYQELIDRYPSAVEAEDARVLLGNLQLGQRAPGAALGEFERYGDGALTPEALWGQARALRSLQSPDERVVLEHIVRDYPDSPYAKSARQRLLRLAP